MTPTYRPPGRRPLATALLLVVVALVGACSSAPSGPGAVALSVPASRGTGQPELLDDPAAAYTSSGTVVPAPARAPKDTPVAYPDGCQVAPEVVTVPPEDECVYGEPGSDVEVALVGDSKMLQWFSAVEAVAEVEGWRVKVYTKSACGFTTSGQYDECLTYNAALRSHLADGERTPDLILTSLGDRAESLGAELADNLAPAVRAGAQVVLVADNPVGEKEEWVDGQPWYTCVAEHPDEYGTCSFSERAGRGTASIEEAHAQLEGSTLVDLTRWICPPGTAVPGAPDEQPRCPLVIGGVLVLREGSHLTDSYVRTLTPYLHAALAEAGIARTPVEEIAWDVRLGD
ncbi:SGNH hydrolase domain-containing protein [Ornithinimicrobium tianjinense]|uniref:SGNH domain-containing protein n=1 Tax=Ornithinimicrobium tianjinense TaxID=1195761 RepID=A0A917BQ19_9MICO|nr:SGNH hydrolase domain-containing protein [Ornithinimicrobium tianjinense]GGF52681.1 hypothetical protein GCM10011366_20610 [Ornithinimicrobium tianjinense]